MVAPVDRPWRMIPRSSLHVEPVTILDFFRHYLRDLVYGANDGVITTFAVVAGLTGGRLSAAAVLIAGVANLLADGLAMGVGNYLSIRADESARAAQKLPEAEAAPLRHGLALFVAFVVAGALPLLPYLVGDATLDAAQRFTASILITLSALFGVGAARALVTEGRWWVGGLEMFALGAMVAGVAYGSGRLVAAVLAGG